MNDLPSFVDFRDFATDGDARKKLDRIFRRKCSRKQEQSDGQNSRAFNRRGRNPIKRHEQQLPGGLIRVTSNLKQMGSNDKQQRSKGRGSFVAMSGASTTYPGVAMGRSLVILVRKLKHAATCGSRFAACVRRLKFG